MSTPMTRGKPCTCGGRGRRRGEHLHALQVREHSDDSREAVPLDGGGHQGWIVEVIKDGLRRSSRTDCGGHQGRRRRPEAIREL